jgi:multiple sugar transport system substrate-binding protein
MASFPPVPASRRSFLVRSGAVLMAGAALPLLAACGSSAGTTAAVSSGAATSLGAASGGTTAQGSASAQQSGSTSAAPASQAAAGQKASGSITWLVPEDPLLDKFSRQGIVPDFKKAQPNINVQVVSPGSTAYGEKLLALVAAGTTPEVFTDWGNVGIFTLQSHQIVTDLSTYINQAKIDMSFLLPTYVTEYSANGSLFAVPWNSNPNFIVYNKTLFQKDNVALPPTDWNDKSWTTDKMLAAAQSLTHATGDPSTSTFGLIMGAGSVGSLGWLWNADPFNNTGGPEASTVYQGQPFGQVYPDRQGMADAMTWLADLTLKHKVSPTPTDTKALSTQGNPIFSGRVGMAEVAGGWLERQAAVAKPHFDWGIAPMPYGPGGKNIGQREDNAWYIGKGSKNPDGGFQLIMFASRGTGADDLITFAEDNPPLSDTSYFTKWSKSVLAIPGMSMAAADFQAVFEGGIKTDYPDPTNVINDATEFSNAFNQLMAPVWIGKQTSLTALQAVKAKWQGIIQNLAQQAKS